MSSVDDFRRRIYEDDDSGPGGASSSTVGPSRSSSFPARSAAAPYSRTASGGGRGRSTSFLERMQNSAGDDDDDEDNYGFIDEPGGMDVDTSNPAVGAVRGTQMYSEAFRHRPGARSAAVGVHDDREETDVKRLLRAWQNERHAPDILPAEDELLVRMLDEIRRQNDDANSVRADGDMSEEEHYMTMLVLTEVERMKFVVRSYVRTRLFKIEQYAAYIMENAHVQRRLTEAELRHAQSYAKLVVAQYNRTVLDHLPESQRFLNDEIPTIPNMITEPNKDLAVFFHALQDCGQVQLPDGSGFEVTKGSIHLMRYRTIEQHLLRGEVELV